MDIYNIQTIFPFVLFVFYIINKKFIVVKFKIKKETIVS